MVSCTAAVERLVVMSNQSDPVLAAKVEVSDVDRAGRLQRKYRLLLRLHIRLLVNDLVVLDTITV